MLFSPSAAELHVLPIGESAPGFSGCRESSHLGSVSSVLLEAGWLDQVAVPDLLYQSPAAAAAAAAAAAVCCDALLLTSSSFSSSMLLCPSSAVQLVDTTLAFYCEPPLCLCLRISFHFFLPLWILCFFAAVHAHTGR